MPKKDAIKLVVQELTEIWLKARVPTAEVRSIVRKFENVLDKYRNVCRNMSRREPAQEAHETDFENSSKLLFDVSYQQAQQMIKIDEDRQFLEDQRGDRKMCMGKVDKELAAKEDRKALRMEKEEKRMKTEKQRQQECNSMEAGPSESNFTDTDTDTDAPAAVLDFSSQSTESSGEEVRAKWKSQADDLSCKRARVSSTKQAITPEISAALDRTNVSNRKAAFILHAAAHSYGHEVTDMPLSTSSIRRFRSKHRIATAAESKASSVSEGRLVVHFDGKLLPAIAGGPEKEDRVAILVTGLEVEKILAIPKVARGTGELVARAASECLHEWNLAENTVGMSFDTTAANTGHLSGACVLLEQKLGTNLLWLACRHHMLEVVCGSVFKKLFGATSGPNVPLFRRFQEYWPNIIQADFKACSDKRLAGALYDLRSEAVSFCMDILT